MPTEVSTVDLLLQVGGVRGMEKFHKALDAAAKNFEINPKAMASVKKQAETIAKMFNSTLAKANLAGLDKVSASITQRFDAAQTAMSDTVQNMAEIAAEIQLLEGKGRKEDAKALRSELRAEKEKLAALEKRITMEMQALDDLIDKRSEALKGMGDLGQTGADLADAFADGLGKLSQNDVRGLTDAFAKGLRKVGGLAGSASTAMGGAEGGAAAANLAKLGTVAVALGGVALAIGAVVKLLIDADSQTKDWNKSLIDAAGAADFAYSSASMGIQNLTSSLSASRQEAINLALEFRQTPEDMLKILSAANEAGFTFSEMRDRLSDTGDEAQAFREMMKTSLVYAKNLGVSTDEIAQTTAHWMHDFGGGLQTIQEGYSAIFQASMEAGIGSKRFFSMVTQATAGLALYNVRIEQTAALIAELSEVLGDEGASQFVQGLQKGFGDESYQDRFKRILISGGAAGRVLSADATSSTGSFQRKLDQTPGGGMIKGLIDEMTGGGDLVKGLAKLSEQDRRVLLRRVGDVDSAMGRQLDGLIDLAKGTSGSLSDQAKAMDNLSAGGKLAMQLQGAMGVIGSPISEMNAIQLAAFEQMTGLSGEQLEELRRVDRMIRADYDLAKESGKFTGSLEEYIVSRGDEFKDALDNTMPVQEALARQLVENSESVLTFLSTTVKQLLEGISQSVSMVAAWTGGMSAGEVAAQQKVLETLALNRDAATSALREGRAGLSALTADGHRLTPEEEARKQQLEAQVAAAEEELARTREMEAKARTMQGGFAMFNKGESDMLQEVGAATGRTERVLGPDGRHFLTRKVTESTLRGTELLEQARADQKETADSSTKTAEEVADLRKDMPMAVAEGLEIGQMVDLLGASGMTFGSERERGEFLKKMMVGDTETMGKLRGALSDKKLSDALTTTAMSLGVNPAQDDFIMRGNTVTPIHPDDDIIGRKNLGGGGRGPTINIYGGDQAKVYETVKKVMRESGVRPGPGR